MIKRCLALLFAISLCGTRAAVCEELRFSTEAPLLVEGPRCPAKRLPSRLLTWDEYRERASGLRGKGGGYEPLAAVPDALGPLLGIGLGLRLDRKMRAYAVFGSSTQGYAVFIDRDGDGSLANEVGLPMALRDGCYVTDVEAPVTEEINGAEGRYVDKARIVMTPATPSCWVSSRTTRDGTIVLADRSFAFRLWGRGGLYDDEDSDLWFDLDGNGQGSTDRFSDERFLVVHRTVTIDGISYGFQVDRYGRELALTPLAEPRADRPSLRTGAAAPELDAADSEGHSVSLFSLRGRVVLLYFWSSGCGTFRAEAPDLRALVERSKEAGLVAVGVTSDSSEEMRAAVSDLSLPGPQVRDAEGTPLHWAYRVTFFPTYFLIDRAGRIAAADILLDDEAIERVLSVP